MLRLHENESGDSNKLFERSASHSQKLEKDASIADLTGHSALTVSTIFDDVLVGCF